MIGVDDSTRRGLIDVANLLPGGVAEMNRLGRILLPGLTFLIVATGNADSEDHVIRPGNGIDLIHVGEAMPDESIRESLTRKQIFFTSENAMVTSVIILNPGYRTREGVKVGDGLSSVSEAYGNVGLVSVPIVKGDYQIGNAGKVMKYPGISFYLTGDVVSAIAVHGER